MRKNQLSVQKKTTTRLNRCRADKKWFILGRLIEKTLLFLLIFGIWAYANGKASFYKSISPLFDPFFLSPCFRFPRIWIEFLSYFWCEFANLLLLNPLKTKHFIVLRPLAVAFLTQMHTLPTFRLASFTRNYLIYYPILSNSPQLRREKRRYHIYHTFYFFNLGL